MSGAQYEHILFDVEDGIVRLRMNRPHRRNALSAEHLAELLDALQRAGDRSDIRVITLFGEGPAFCSGHDLTELAGADARSLRGLFRLCSDLMLAIQKVPQPVIAGVHGVASAAGCQLVAACDLAVACSDATFVTPGVRIGLFCSTPMVPLARAIGRKKALEMLLTGEPLTADEALRHGLVNRVVEHERLESEVLSLAAKIAEASPLTVGLGKQAFYRQLELDEAKAYDYAIEVMTLNALAADAQEGICAFLEKRRPVWKGE